MPNKLIDLEEIFQHFMKYANEINIFNTLIFTEKYIWNMFY